MVAILGFSRERIIAAVKEMYTAVATAPERPYHFPVGRSACVAVGYSERDLESVPAEALQTFAGVGCPYHAGSIRKGDTVLDLGAGGGTDTCIAARVVGTSGKVFALDMTAAMLAKLRALKERYRLSNVEVIEGSAESIPLPDASVDVVTSNGVLNLVPDKRKAVAEIFRVLRPGGRAQIADIVIARPVDPDCSDDPKLWAECVVGATVDDDYLNLFRDAGFDDVTILRSYDYFALSRSPDTREIAQRFGARAVELCMRRMVVAPSKLLQLARRADPRRAWSSLARRGLAGTAALALALLSCYGTLLAAALLSYAGLTHAFNDTVIAGLVTGFAALALLAVYAGARRHGRRRVLALAGTGAAVIVYAMFVQYHALIELLGFVLLGTGVFLDLKLRLGTDRVV